MDVTGNPGGGSGSGIGGMLDGSQQKMMEESFKEFCSRPENRKVMEAHQRKEMKKQEKQRLQLEAARFQEIVLSSDYDSQKNIAPYLKYPVLRKIIQTFTNDPNGDFGRWASNERVLSMLSTAKEIIDEGRMSEHEIENVMLEYITSGFKETENGSGRSDSQKTKPTQDKIGMTEEEWKLRTRQKVRLTTDQLVAPLNEHLGERSKGNEFYRRHDLISATSHYHKALGIVEYISGVSSSDQYEIDNNKIAVLLNLAAVKLEEKEYGAAVDFCNKALELRPNNMKALQRRCKAHIGRRNYPFAQADIDAMYQLDRGSVDADELKNKLRKVRMLDRDTDKAFGKNMNLNVNTLGNKSSNSVKLKT